MSQGSSFTSGTDEKHEHKIATEEEEWNVLKQMECRNPI
jgi:hypothetical protein